ncbi:hypothetical protein BFX40_10770 [Mesorhizobium sp. SEMIA 3007]|nr:hypothetical protein BFX40_10770 [Mesorhizobium sp. SEMIA 3007]
MKAEVGAASISHATLVIAAYGFLVSEQRLISPQPHAQRRSSRHLRYPKIIDPRRHRSVPNAT